MFLAMNHSDIKGITPTETALEEGVQSQQPDQLGHELGKELLPEGHDDALELFDGPPENFVYSAKEANRVRWKLDLILLPMVSGGWC